MNFLQRLFRTGELELWKRQKSWNRRTHILNYLFWEATLRCNFKCEHCGSSCGPEVYPDELNTEEVKKAFESIAEKYDPARITVAITGGEPLLRKDFFEVTKYISDLGFPWGLVTNGYLVNQDFAQKLKNSGMSTVTVSIDDIGEKHDEFRGMKGAYERAISALKNLSDVGSIKNIQITTTITSRTKNKYEQLYQRFKDLPIDSWRVMNVSPIGRTKQNRKLLLNKGEIVELLDFIKNKRNNKDTKFEVVYGCENFLGLEYESVVRPYLFECRAGINVGSILHNGDIFVCPNVPRSEELIQGNVRKDDFVEVWENKFEYFRDPNTDRTEDCKNCEYWEYCEGGSRHLTGNKCFIGMD